ncbi:MAG: murein peptide amidase [Gaiellaceae bacterium]|nr:murein peptide amidase [Gaiellaceae bacterium]
MLSTLAAVVVVGQSVQHRPISLVHVRGPGPRILVVGCIHGNEPAGIAVVRALERTHPKADLWLVPVLNPDGLAAGTRQNAHGVDLNRNFPSLWQHFGHPGSTYYSGPRPFSEPETRIARDLIRRIRPQVTIWFHQHLNLVWAYGRSTRAGRRYARLAGMRFLHRPWLAGSSTNWQNHLPRGGASLTVELPAGTLSESGVSRQVRAVLAAATNGS